MTTSKLQDLRNLASDPQAQARLALDLIAMGPKKPRADRQTIMGALRVLVETPLTEARPALLALYAYYAARGVTLDTGTYLRTDILRALRSLTQPADIPLLEQALLTYEFPAPEFVDEAALLRSTALVLLNQLDERLTGFHAARLVGDRNTNRMSGEPALTAIRVLASQDELLPLYAFTMHGGGPDRFDEDHDDSGLLPDLISESLRLLTTLPESLLPGLIARYGPTKDGLILIGLFDLLLTHESGPHGQVFLLDFLRNTGRYDAYRYLLTMLIARVTSGREAFLPELLDVARIERDKEKIYILQETLSILSHDPEVTQVLESLHRR